MEPRGLLLSDYGQCSWMSYEEFLQTNNVNPHNMLLCALTEEVGICFDVESNRKTLMGVLDFSPEYLPFLKGPLFLIGIEELEEVGEIDTQDLLFRDIAPFCDIISTYWSQPLILSEVIAIAEGLRPPLVLI